MNRCTVCGGTDLRTALDLGPQPPSNRFLSSVNDAEDRYTLSLGDCASCGTVQLVDRMPVEAIRPRYNWLANSEPEGHLDQLVENVARLPGISSSSRVIGITYKDRSTLDRLRRRGFANVQELPTAGLAGPQQPAPFGLETIQRWLCEPGCIDRLLETSGTAHVVLARHIVEHAESASQFLSGLRRLAGDGYVVLEFPDNARILRSDCHAFIWEEHFSYFTENSFRSLAARAGADLVRFDRYTYPHEDALVGVLQFSASDRQPERVVAAAPGSDICRFASTFEPARERWQEKFSRAVADGHRIAVFGAGHLAVKFINFMGLVPWLDCVVDDNPAKVGMRMPGSRLPIVPSATLAQAGIDLLISTLSPESETRARSRLTDFFQSGGCLQPAFATAEA